MEKAACSIEGKAQQSSTWSEEPKGIAKEKKKERNVRRMFKILREVWLDIRIEKIDTHEGVTVKALLNSSAIRIFIDREMAKKHGFKMMKLERPLKVKNVDRTENSRGNIMHQVKVNIFYKNHVKKIRIDVCNLGKTEVILRMPWLQVHNLKINWEIEEMKIMRCLLFYERNLVVKENIEQRKKMGKRIRNIEKANREKWK